MASTNVDKIITSINRYEYAVQVRGDESGSRHAAAYAGFLAALDIPDGYERVFPSIPDRPDGRQGKAEARILADRAKVIITEPLLYTPLLETVTSKGIALSGLKEAIDLYTPYAKHPAEWLLDKELKRLELNEKRNHPDANFSVGAVAVHAGLRLTNRERAVLLLERKKNNFVANFRDIFRIDEQ